MNKTTAIFTATDPWGTQVVLTEQDWVRITAKRPGVSGYEDYVRHSIEQPNVVYEGRYHDSKLFYAKDLLAADPLYKGCYVCTVVRYPQHGAASIRTVYFPYNIQGKLGKILRFN